MKAGTKPSAKDRTAAREIDDIVAGARDWQGRTLSRVRRLILRADPAAVEEVKWKKPSNPEGVPVWSHDGIICVGNLLKNAVRLTFPRGADVQDPRKLFNARLDSRTVRAVDFYEGVTIDDDALRAIVTTAVRLNTAAARSG